MDEFGFRFLFHNDFGQIVRCDTKIAGSAGDGYGAEAPVRDVAIACAQEA